MSAVLVSRNAARELGKRGGQASQAENRAMALETRAWCEQCLAEFTSLNKLALAAIEAKLNASTWFTVRRWITEWAKEWKRDGFWTW